MDELKPEEMTQWLHNPNAKPSKELSKHDQRMIQLGWDACAKSQVCPYLSEEYCPDCNDREDCQVYAGAGKKLGKNG